MELHYEVYGSGQGLVLLHGFTGRGSNWLPLVGRLQSQFKVVTVDLPGHGRSLSDDVRDYTMDACADALINLFDCLNLERVHLLGYSMGGRTALYTAVKYTGRIDRLILESTSPGLATTEERDARIQSDEALAKRIEDEGIEAFVDYWESIPLFASQKALPEDVRRKVREQRLDNQPQGLAYSLRGMGTGTQPSLWDTLGKLTMPVLLMAGELDTKFTTIGQKMEKLLPQAQLQIIKNAGHTPHLERPGEFLAHVTDFLSA
jgi:2-succinyl-6-hydroxy-2,4-cyclohexadiene-1-carboxylate synthase